MTDPELTRRKVVAGGLAATGIVVLGSSALGAVRATHHGGAATSRGPSPTTHAGSTAATSPATTPTAEPTVAVARTAAQLAAKLDAYRVDRGGTFGVALYDRRDRSTFHYRSTWHNETLSTVKVLIMATVLRRCQERGVSLSTAQVAQARAMITESDNDAADALLTWSGLADVRRVARLFGLSSTVVQGGTRDGEDGWWGYSTTTADDLLTLLTGLVWGRTVLTATHRNYLESLMSQIIAIQRWGVCAPPLPATVRSSTKNGWGGRKDGYRANSLGHISGNGRDYAAVILSRAPYRSDYTIERDHAFATVNGVSRILYDAMERPLR